MEAGQSDTQLVRPADLTWTAALATEPPSSVQIPGRAELVDVETVVAYLRKHYPSVRGVRIVAVFAVYPGL